MGSADKFWAMKIRIGSLVLVFLSIKLVLVLALEYNLDRIYVLGLDSASYFLFSSPTENQRKLSCFICEENDITEILSKVKDRGKASMVKLLTEAGDKTALERFKENSFDHASCKLRILNISKALS